MITPKQDIEANQKRHHEYRRMIDSAIEQARCAFLTDLHAQRERWSADMRDRLAVLLQPFDQKQIYTTVHEAMMRSQADFNSCVLAEFTALTHGKELARHAAHVAAGLIRDSGHKAQVRRYGDKHAVKLLDV